jgi:glycosyltransferase involved in cell wall biosynthesis
VKIALITRRYPPLVGGAEKALGYLAAALDRTGAEVVVVTSAIPGRSIATDPADRPRVIRLPTSRLRFVGTYMYMNNLKKWLYNHDIDIAYVSMLKHDAYVAVGAGVRRGFPVVLRPEGAGATGDLAWQKRGRFGATIGGRCRFADAYVSISAAIERELVAEGYDRKRIHSLPNGVPIPEIAWKPRGASLDRVRATFVGRLAVEKNLEKLVDAWRIVVKRRPGAELTLLGEGPMRVKLEERIRSLDLTDSVRLPGAVENPLIFLKDSDLFVLPSIEEGMSVALLEAMALGLPIVASAIPGNRAILEDCVHGRLADPADPEALAGTIERSLDDYETSIRLGEAARRRAIERHSIEAVAQNHLRFFQSIIDQKRNYK